MSSRLTPPLVSCEWLAERLAARDIAILDATFVLPNQGRQAEQEYLVEHIPGAKFFDVDTVADMSDPLPHMLPTPEFFAASVGRLGIDNTTHVVVYDNNDFMASARLWWTFRVFGHDRVSVLDGGLKRWLALGRGFESGLATLVTSRRFEAYFRAELVRNLDEVRSLLAQSESQIADARSPGRFMGSEPEPRPGLRSGHIPGSKNVFFKTLIDESSGLMKSSPAIDGVFRNAGLDLQRPIVTTCGTGVTAAVLALGLFRLGREDVPVYDGSWAEWGGREDTPIELG